MINTFKIIAQPGTQETRTTYASLSGTQDFWKPGILETRKNTFLFPEFLLDSGVSSFLNSSLPGFLVNSFSLGGIDGRYGWPSSNFGSPAHLILLANLAFDPVLRDRMVIEVFIATMGYLEEK